MTKQLDIETLAQLIYAQNFSMPAGYVQDKDGESWLLKVGEEYNSVKDISGALLLHVEGYGDVRLSDVADVEVIDNSADSYTRLNGEKASILKIYKNATSSAGEVSDNCLTAFKELEKQYDGLHMVCCPIRATTSPLSSTASSPAWWWALHWPSSCWPSS